ncbi:DUF1573 domain-containing protein [Candidatus Gottesmanbacteria bacterium]|nr:DUF1573 domain-containing protein [Candidatus Gottesmanbacteria bacterium]
MKSDRGLIIGIIIATVAIIGGAVLILGKNTGSASRTNMGTAEMRIDKSFEDFGSMKADEERTATFTITNTSESTLRLWNVATSCDCTFATMTIGDVTAGEFNMSMHMSADLRNWMGEVQPGQTAILRVIYRPKVMPVTGIVTRQVTFVTNDPQNATVEVSVKANVL